MLMILEANSDVKWSQFFVVKSRSLHGLIFEPPWFLLYINDSPDDLFSTPNLFADEAWLFSIYLNIEILFSLEYELWLWHSEIGLKSYIFAQNTMVNSSSTKFQ